MPAAELIQAMGASNHQLMAAGVMVDGGGLKPTLAWRARRLRRRRSALCGWLCSALLANSLRAIGFGRSTDLDEAIAWVEPRPIRCPARPRSIFARSTRWRTSPEPAAGVGRAALRPRGALLACRDSAYAPARGAEGARAKASCRRRRSVSSARRAAWQERAGAAVRGRRGASRPARAARRLRPRPAHLRRVDALRACRRRSSRRSTRAPFKSLKKLRKSEDDVDFIVADTRGLADDLTKELAEDSDVVFLPTGTSLDDLRPTLALARKLASAAPKAASSSSVEDRPLGAAARPRRRGDRRSGFRAAVRAMAAARRLPGRSRRRPRRPRDALPVSPRSRRADGGSA